MVGGNILGVRGDGGEARKRDSEYDKKKNPAVLI